MDYVASIGIGTGLDLSGLYAGLQQIQSVKVPVIPATISIDQKQIQGQLITATRNLQKLNSIVIRPKVDHTELIALNKHFDLKKRDFDGLQGHFNRNPLKPKVDGGELDALEVQLDRIERRTSQAIRRFNNPSFRNIQSEKQVEVTVDTSKIANSIAQITKAISGIGKKNVFQSIGSTITGVLTAPFKLVGGAIERVITGALEGIGQPLGRDIGKGITKGLESQLSSFIGSFEHAGEKIGEEIANGIVSAMGSKVFQIRETFQEILGKEGVAVAGAATRSGVRTSQQKRAQAAKNQFEYDARSLKEREPELKLEREQINQAAKGLKAFQSQLMSKVLKAEERAGVGNLTQEMKQTVSRISALAAENKDKGGDPAIEEEIRLASKELNTIVNRRKQIVESIAKQYREDFEKLSDLSEKLTLRQFKFNEQFSTTEGADLIASSLNKYKRPTSQSQRTRNPAIYNNLAQRVAADAGISLDPKNIPGIVLDPDRPAGSPAAYAVETNKIKLNKDLYQKIIQGRLEEFSNLEFEVLTHELRHASQYGFGSQNNKLKNFLKPENPDEVKSIRRNVAASVKGSVASGVPVQQAIDNEVDAYLYQQRRSPELRQQIEKSSISDRINLNLGYQGGAAAEQIRSNAKRLKSLNDVVTTVTGNLGVDLANQLKNELKSLGDTTAKVAGDIDRTVAASANIDQMDLGGLKEFESSINQQLAEIEQVTESIERIKNQIESKLSPPKSAAPTPVVTQPDPLMAEINKAMGKETGGRDLVQERKERLRRELNEQVKAKQLLESGGMSSLTKQAIRSGKTVFESSLPPDYVKFLETVADLSETKLPKDLPQAVLPGGAALEAMMASGAEGFYNPVQKQVKLRHEVYQALKAGTFGKLPLAQRAEGASTLTHEIRHGAQYGFGKLTPDDFLKGERPAVKLLKATKEEWKLIGDAVNRSVERYTGSLPKELIKELEEDAYTFEVRNTEKIAKAFGWLKTGELELHQLQQEQGIEERLDPSNLPGYNAIAKQVAQISGVSMAKMPTPVLPDAQTQLAMLNYRTSAEYDPNYNNIRLRRGDIANLKQGNLSRQFTGSLAHELRHSLQTRGGQISQKQMEQGDIGVSLMKLTQEEYAKVGKRLEGSVKGATSQGMSEKLARQLEEDAYAFELRYGNQIHENLKSMMEVAASSIEAAQIPDNILPDNAPLEIPALDDALAARFAELEKEVAQAATKKATQQVEQVKQITQAQLSEEFTVSGLKRLASNLNIRGLQSAKKEQVVGTLQSAYQANPEQFTKLVNLLGNDIRKQNNKLGIQQNQPPLEYASVKQKLAQSRKEIDKALSILNQFQGEERKAVLEEIVKEVDEQILFINKLSTEFKSTGAERQSLAGYKSQFLDLRRSPNAELMGIQAIGGVSPPTSAPAAASEELARFGLGRGGQTGTDPQLDVDEYTQRILASLAQFEKASDQIESRFQESAEGVNVAMEGMGESSSSIVDRIALILRSQLGEAGKLFLPLIDRVRTFLPLLKGVGLAFLAIKAAPQLTELGRQAYETTKAFDSLERSIVFTADSTAQGAKDLEYVRNEVERLNAPVQDATESFNQLSAALKGTKIEGNAQEIFTALNEAALVRQLNPEQRKRFMYGVVQAATKPNLSSEEVNLQIGEAFPGAQNIFARALNETPEDFRKNLRTGQYGGADSVLKFSRQLRTEFSGGVEDAANSAQGLENKVSNLRVQVERMFGSALMPLAVNSLKSLANGLELVIANADKIALVLGAIALQQIPVIALTKGLIALVKALPSAMAGLPTLLAGLGGLAKFTIQTAALSLALKVLFDTYQSFQGSSNLDSAIEKNIKQFKRLEEAASKAGGITAKTFNDLDKKLNRDRSQTTFMERFSRNFNPIERISGTYNQFQSGIRTKSRQDDIREFNKRVDTTLNNSQVKPEDAERARELSKKLADPFISSVEKETDVNGMPSIKKQKEAIDVRVRNQKEMVEGLLEAANAELEAIDELWARSDITREQADLLKEAARRSIPKLEAEKKQLENFADGQVSLIKVMREQLTKVTGAYTDANTAIATNTSIYQGRIAKAQVSGILSPGLTPGQAQYAQQMLQQRSLEAQIQSGQGTLGQLNKYVYTPDNKQILFNQGIDPATVQAEELKRLSDLSNKPEEKLLYERLTKIREIEGTVAQQEAQLATSQAEVAIQLYELGKSVDEYLRGITRQTAELELTVEASQASFAIAAEKNRLVSKLQGFQANFFSGFVDSLISGLDSINAAQQAETQRKQALLQNQFQAEDTIRSGNELMRTLPDGLPSDLVPSSIPAIPVKLDVDALQASAGIQDLKGAIAEAVGISRDLNAATVAVNMSLTQTAIAGASVSSEFKEVNTDLQGWNKFLADIGFTWNYVQKEFQSGTKENLELQQRWNNLLSIPGILMQRLAGIVGVALLKSFNPVLAAVAELLARLGLFPDSVEKIRSKVLSLGFDFKGVTETVTGLGQSIVDSIGNAIDTVKQKIQELRDGGAAETAQEGIAASFAGFGGTGGSAGASGSGAFASGLYTGPAGNIGKGAAYHIDSKIAKSIGRDMAIQLIDQMAAAYNAQGRDMLFSNAAVAGKTWRTDASKEEKYALLEQIDAAHNHSPNPSLWDFDYYVPKKGGSVYDKSTEGAEFLLPSVAGGRVEYASGGGYGNHAIIYDSKGNLVMKTGHGDNRKNLPANRTLASVTASTNLNVGSGSKGQFQLPNVGGAGRIPRGGTIGSAERVQSDPAGAVALVKAAQRLGLDPIEFASLMSWESGGTLNPNVFGGDGNAYKGIIQFSPDNQRTYGTSGQQSIAQQIPAVERYLKDRGFQPGKHDIRHAYSAVLAGQASERYWDASDSNGTTVRNAAPKFRQGEHNARARQFLKDSGIDLNNVASSGQRSAVLGVSMNNPNTGNAQRVASGQAQIVQNRSSQDQLAIQQEQQALADLKTRGELEQKNRTEQTRQSLTQLAEQTLANNREFRNLGFAIGDPTPLREFQQQTTATKDTYDDMRRKLVEFQRQTRAGVEQAKRTESELTAPGYQVQPGQNLQEDIATTRKVIAAGSKTLSEVDKILAGIDDQQKRREAFEKERFAREEKLRRLAERDMLTQEKIAETQAQLRKAQLAQQRNPRDFSQGDPIALQAQLDLMQQLLPLDQKRVKLAEDLRTQQITPEGYNQAIASLQKQEKAIVDNTEAAKKFGLQERQMQFREADFAFLQRQNQASGALTQEQLRAAELFQQTRPFDTTQGDPNTIRYGQSVIQIEQERQQQLLEQDRFALTNTNRSQEELNAIRAKINQASDKRLENARVEFEQNQQRVNQEKLDFELRRKQQNQQSDLSVTQTRMAGLGAAGIDSSFLTQQVQEAQNQIQYDSSLRELEKTRALTNLTAEDYARQKTNLDQVLTLQKEQSAIARSMSIFSKRAEYGNLKADVLAGNGAEFTAQAIRRETALAQQTLNFTAQIAQLDALKGTIPNEELERMRRQIIEIDRLKTDQIRQQFADLSREIELAGRDATKGFFKGFLVEGKGVFESLKDSFNQLKNQIMGRLVDIGVEALFKGKNTGKDTGGGLLGSILGSVTGAATGGSPFGFLSGVLGFSEGGMVPGRDIGVDTVPAMLRPGEYVMSRDGVANMGSAFLESVNSGEMPSYQQREYSSGEPQERSSTMTVQYEKIGERNYVTQEQFEQGVRYAAQQGAQGGAKITSNWLRNSPSERRRHGV